MRGHQGVCRLSSVPNRLRLSWKVDECKPMAYGGGATDVASAGVVFGWHEVGQCRLTVSRTVLKGPFISSLETVM